MADLPNLPKRLTPEQASNAAAGTYIPPSSQRQVSQPQVSQRQVSQPQVSQRQVSQPQVTLSQVSQPQVTLSQVSQPQVTLSQVSQPQVTLSQPTIRQPPQRPTPVADISTQRRVRQSAQDYYDRIIKIYEYNETGDRYVAQVKNGNNMILKEMANPPNRFYQEALKISDSIDRIIENIQPLSGDIVMTNSRVKELQNLSRSINFNVALEATRDLATISENIDKKFKAKEGEIRKIFEGVEAIKMLKREFDRSLATLSRSQVASATSAAITASRQATIAKDKSIVSGSPMSIEAAVLAEAHANDAVQAASVAKQAEVIAESSSDQTVINRNEKVAIAESIKAQESARASIRASKSPNRSRRATVRDEEMIDEEIQLGEAEKAAVASVLAQQRASVVALNAPNPQTLQSQKESSSSANAAIDALAAHEEAVVFRSPALMKRASLKSRRATVAAEKAEKASMSALASVPVEVAAEAKAVVEGEAEVSARSRMASASPRASRKATSPKAKSPTRVKSPNKSPSRSRSLTYRSSDQCTKAAEPVSCPSKATVNRSRKSPPRSTRASR